jgi:hypothetical protein
MKFCGKYYGKYNKTEIRVVNGEKVIIPSKGPAEVTISKVGCGAYLINVIQDGNNTNEFATLEDNVLRSVARGDGKASIYFEDNILIRQMSVYDIENDGTETLRVNNFSLKKCKC